MNRKKIVVLSTALIISLFGVFAFATATPASKDVQFKKALSLYERGMFSQARILFDEIDDVQARGYSLLCAVNLNEDDYEYELNRYVSECPYSGLLPQIYWQHALNLFDEGQYAQAKNYFSLLSEKDVDKAKRAELIYKTGYSDFETNNRQAALASFERVDAMPHSDYTAPSRYAIGYILYEEQDFEAALPWFEQSVKDQRFEEVSNYYIMECRFMMKDYKYVTDHGAELYANVPSERKPHLARIISESYLVRGDADSAREYYDKISDFTGKERGDYFYAGTLMYTVGEYQAAIDNYLLMMERRDSIGQIANYNMGYAYIQTKNKVAALEAFKDASESDHDPKLTEDAFYNYAKLAFDLNDDNGVFNAYLEKYSDKVKGDAIYEYMALSSLYDRDYAGAIAAYDNIDELDEDMRGNYMKANYLRAEQLIGNGSWRNAIPCLRASAYYSDKLSFFNQLTRYWLAESYYRNEQYQMSRSLFTELYNISALDGKPEGSLIPYNLAYCYYKENNFQMASKWFDEYLKSSDAVQRKDALVRKADCFFALKDYKTAAEAYSSVISEFESMDDLYPYYQAGVSYGLSGEDQKEVEVLSKVSSASPKAEFFNDAYYELGRAYLNVGETDKAESSFTYLVENSEDKSFVAKSLLDLGSIARNRKAYEESLTYYKKVVANMPDTEYSQDALTAIELIYQTIQEPETYIAYIESIGKEGSVTELDKEEILFNAAEQMYLSGTWQKALVSLQNYQNRFPSGKYISQTDFYIAECYRSLEKKDQAVDFYKKVLDSDDSSFQEVSALNAASLSYQIENYADALDYYRRLASIARMDQNKHIAAVGMMTSAYMAKQYDYASEYADVVNLASESTDAEKLNAVYIKAKSKLASSERDEAMQLFKSISGKTTTAQGAEAAYILIQDSSDKGDFEDVEEQVYALSESGCDQTYWLAKSFILLGDSFVEREDFRQARATFESVRDGYVSQGPDDDVLDNVNMRLEKLDEMGK